MAFAWFTEHRRRRREKQRYRAMVKKWYSDGGDNRFRFDYPLDSRSLVLDVGGYEGQWASDVYARYRCRIMVFEPVARFAHDIAERFRHNTDITVFPYGLGASARSEAIYLRGAGSSTHRKASEAETIEIADVRQWLAEHGIGSVQLMKVNIEGGEYELLESLIAADLIGTIENIQVQFHYFAADAEQRMTAIQRDLARTHEPTYQYRFVWENWRRK
jgi:FkbM family methyltransferase